VLTAIVCALLLPHASPAGEAPVTVLDPALLDLPERGARPLHNWKLDVPIVAAGVTGYLVGRNLGTDRRPVPMEGFQASDVRLDLDRRTLGHDAVGAGDASDVLRDVALTYPFVLRAVSARGGGELRSTLSVALLYLESLAIAEGVTGILKRSASRPRPYTYLSDSERPTEPQYDVSKPGAFQSFPSGHATASWCAISTGVLDHLRSRPGASWKEHAAVGLIGGVLGTATASLRVEAGQHFPSDVAAGAAIGIASSAAVSLLHRYAAGDDRSPWPPRRSWLASLAGTAAGVGIGLVTAEALDR
jgi:membrane-associated phospholipid phosphatase